MVPQLTELSFYYMNLVTVSRLQRNPTVKSEIQMRNFEHEHSGGILLLPNQPGGRHHSIWSNRSSSGRRPDADDRTVQEIVHKFNAVYGETLTEPQIILPENASCCRLPGIDGKAKMSKSLGNCIYLSDEPKEIERKVMSMFTDPNHIKVSDPGRVEGNPVFSIWMPFVNRKISHSFCQSTAVCRN